MTPTGDVTVSLSTEQERARAAAARLKRYRAARDRARARRLATHPYLARLLGSLLPCAMAAADARPSCRIDVEAMRRHW